jgi:hypothetical protein
MSDKCMAIRLGGYDSAFSCTLPPHADGNHLDQTSGTTWDDEPMPEHSPPAQLPYDQMRAVRKAVRERRLGK